MLRVVAHGSGVVVDVRFLPVVLILVGSAVVVAVCQRIVVMLVGVPERSMLELPQDSAGVVV